MNLRSLPTAFVLMFALLAIPAAINSEYIGPGESITVILGFVSIAMFFWAGFLHYKVILRDGANLALLHLLLWLGILMVMLPNLTMILLLYGGKLAVIAAPFGLLLLLTGSIYYLLPYQIFGEQFFLDETVISPDGMVGILVSILFWTVVVTVTVFSINSITRFVGQSTKRDR